MEKREETKGRNQTPHIERNEIRKNKSLRLRKTMLRKVIPYILVGCIASSAVMMAHNEAEEVKAEAISITALTVCALLAVMATMGITYATQDILDTWEFGSSSPNPDFNKIYESWQREYMKQLLLLQAQQNPDGGGDDDGDGDDDLPSDFDTLIKNIELAGNTAVILKGEWELLKKSGKNLLQKSYELGTLFADATIPDGMNVDPSYINANTKVIFYSNSGALTYRPGFISYNSIIESNFLCCVYKDNESRIFFMHLNGVPIVQHCFDKKGNYLGEADSQLYGAVTKIEQDGYDINKRHVENASGFMCRNVFTNLEDVKRFFAEHSDKNSPIWVTPELQETYENSGQFEFPENLPNPLRVPNIDDLQELARRLNPDSNPDYNPEEIPEYIKQYINDLKVDPSPEPNPDPNPDPDKPDKPVNPDNPDIPTNNDTFLADLKHLFPFCIPFDLVECFKLFNAKPVTPRVEIPIHFGVINYDHTFVIDLKDFNGVATVCRSTFLIIYMTGLILATRALIKG